MWGKEFVDFIENYHKVIDMAKGTEYESEPWKLLRIKYLYILDATNYQHSVKSENILLYIKERIADKKLFIEYPLCFLEKRPVYIGSEFFAKINLSKHKVVEKNDIILIESANCGMTLEYFIKKIDDYTWDDSVINPKHQFNLTCDKIIKLIGSLKNEQF